MRRIVTVKFPLDTLRRIDDLARALETNRSKIIRLVVEEHLKHLNKRIRCPYCGRTIDLNEYYSKHYPREGDL